MKLLGVTGGIGMGKSAASECLQHLGVPVVDTDVIARSVVEPGEPALEEISREFGSEVLAGDGTLDRRELARRVFKDDIARKRLEDILHPRIRATWQAEAESLQQSGQPVAVIVIPLLFETDAQNQFAATVCVACSQETQMTRLAQRGWTAAHSRERIDAQMPIRQKMLNSDFVIWNEAGLKVLEAQLRKVLAAVGC